MGASEERVLGWLFETETVEEAERLLIAAQDYDVDALRATLESAAERYESDGLPAHAALARYFAEFAESRREKVGYGRLPEPEPEPELDLDEAATTALYTAAHERDGVLAAYLHLRGSGVPPEVLARHRREFFPDWIPQYTQVRIALAFLADDEDDRADARVTWIADCRARGAYGHAERHLERLVALHSSPEGYGRLSRALEDLGDLLLGRSDVEGAVDAYRRAIAVPVWMLEESIRPARISLQLATVLRGLGRYQEAMEVLASTGFHPSRVGMASDLSGVLGLAARMHLMYGLLQEDTGDYDAGLESYANARRLAEAANDDQLYHRAWSFMAGSHLKAGRVRLAVQENRRVLDWTREHPGAEPSALNNLAMALYDAGNGAEAEWCYRRVVELLGEEEPSFSLALAWFGLGHVAEDSATAADRFLRGLEIAREAGNRRDALIQILTRPAVLEHHRDRFAELVGEAMELAEAGKDAMLARFAVRARADLLVADGDVAGAVAAIKEQLARPADSAAERVHMTLLLAGVLVDADGSPPARQEAFDLLWTARAPEPAAPTEAPGPQDGPASWDDSDELDGALVALLCDDLPPGRLPDSRDAHELAFDLHEAIKSRRILRGLAGMPLPVPAGVPAELAEREAALLEERRALAARPRGQGQPVDEWTKRGRQGRVDDLLSEVWAQMERHAPGYALLRRAEPITLARLREQLAGDLDTALVSFHAGSAVTVAFVYTPRTGRLAVTRVPVGAGTLARAAAALDRAFNGAPHDFPPLAPLPARRPWKRDLGFLAETAGELLGFLPEVAGSEHLCLSPDGPLHGLPLHALPLSDGTCLGQRHAVTYVPTASALGYLVARRTAAPRPQSIFCAGVAAREDPDPAALERDGDLLRAAGWAVEELSGTNAVRQAVLDALRTRRMAHLTCHGHFDAVNPLDSGLLLADGGERPSREPAALSMPQRLRHLLTVGDLAGAGIDMGLITLRACSTGRYDPTEQAANLAQSLLYAGAGAVIAALWNVDRTSSGRFLESFYRRLAQRPDEPLWRGFWHTQREMIERPLDPWEAHPYHWGALALIGDWR
ncbi:CHAT domain-containing protein [Nonomuraea angiospora]|uniref:CHAT domain-containing protein n=1 Tax=Nonomuraea angiospora TaxID=46172 RepID=UPI0037B8716A